MTAVDVTIRFGVMAFSPVFSAENFLLQDKLTTEGPDRYSSFMRLCCRLSVSTRTNTGDANVDSSSHHHRNKTASRAGIHNTGDNESTPSGSARSGPTGWDETP